MLTDQSTDDLLNFLQHASDTALMPKATAQALMVACRNVFDVLSDAEKRDVKTLDLDKAIARFKKKRGADFSPTSVTEYERRVRRAVDLFLSWKLDPKSFKVRTRGADSVHGDLPKPATEGGASDALVSMSEGGYQTSFPLRPGQLVTLSNVPQDLTVQEAERLGAFIRMLAVG